MPEFTLYGNAGSTTTDRVRLLLAIIGFTDYEFVQLDLMTAEHKQPPHLARHPWGRIPVITTIDGFTIYESRAICKFLAAKHATHLFPSPSDLEATARFDMAQSVEMSYFESAAGTVSFEKFVKPLFGGVTDELVVRGARKKLEEHFHALGEELGEEGEGFVAGEEFGLVDVYYIPLVERIFKCAEGDVVRKRESVRAWWERCLDVDGARKYVEGMPTMEAIKAKWQERAGSDIKEVEK